MWKRASPRQQQRNMATTFKFQQLPTHYLVSRNQQADAITKSARHLQVRTAVPLTMVVPERSSGQFGRIANKASSLRHGTTTGASMSLTRIWCNNYNLTFLLRWMQWYRVSAVTQPIWAATDLMSSGLRTQTTLSTVTLRPPSVTSARSFAVKAAASQSSTSSSETKNELRRKKTILQN